MTIRTREAKQVIGDLLASRGVSKAVCKIAGRELHMLVDGRQVTFSLKAGMSFYGLEALRAEVGRAIDDMQISRNKRQIDLEDLLTGSAR